ncbi:hypothetical protein POM88_040232 [Heracleum sosnowskyi]|uniref:Uncharacterized protein n=1 Tax=Heracleum sosnowskyi TaxID=360622 RepID=A0AAD8HCT7_9APIA|nr:hypothetical protein POM88_040232 [Heracleum sosnowskyi]
MDLGTIIVKVNRTKHYQYSEIKPPAWYQEPLVRPKFLEKGEITYVVGSCGGIICFHIISTSRFVQVNPLTKNYKEVSAPKIPLPHLQASIRANNAGFFYE